MLNCLRLYRTLVLALLLALPASFVQAAPEIMPVSEIKPGMHGIAKTVISGTAIEEFGVEVLGIMKNKGPSGDLILVRTYGDVIDRAGGIAQGMSGSPVYIDGKLAGAIAFGWSLTDHKIGMVTPIADMLKLWDMPDNLNIHKPAFSLRVDEDIEPVATPLMASGFSDQALKMLADKLKPFNMVPYAAATVPQDFKGGKLEPGSAVGVELVRGDVSLGAIGTVTYVEGNRLLALGHPFLKKGNIGYFLTDAYIMTTVNGLENAFKVGATGRAIGLINQDRGAGLAGEMGRYPFVVPLRVTVRDNVSGRTQDAAAQIIHDEQLGPILAATTVFSVIDRTIDRVGPGTARVSFEITARDMPGDVLKRENMFYSPGNIGELAIAEIHEALALLAGNQYNPVDIMDVKVNVTVDEEKRMASIIEARADTAGVRAGEKVDIAVKLKPFRGEPVTRTVSFTVPRDQAPGPLTLVVRGGGMVPLTDLLLKKAGMEEILQRATKDKDRKFEDELKDFANRGRNNDIVVEVLSLNAGDPKDGPEGKGTVKAKVEGIPEPKPRPEQKYRTAAKFGGKPGTGKDGETKAKNFVTTDYIIDGDAQVLINVIAEGGKETDK